MRNFFLWLAILFGLLILVYIFKKNHPIWLTRLMFWERQPTVQNQYNEFAEVDIPSTAPIEEPFRTPAKRGRKPGSSSKPRTGLGK